VQLTLARAREFYREPEAVFWVFGFPVVLAFALGIAFRNQGPDDTRSRQTRPRCLVEPAANECRPTASLLWLAD